MSDQILDEVEKEIFSAVESGDAALLQTALAKKPNVNIVDENLMTPLQHAAFKGNKQLVQILLDYGADPNLCKHQHNYTALHFAGLSGNFEVCLALLISGAKPDVTNTVNRTAAQMAAFVGHHNCVAIINNYVDKSEVTYYTKAQGVQSEPYLPSFLVDSFHKLLIQVNMHPVKVAINAFNFVGIADHLAEVKKVLQLMSDKEMKKEGGSNEVMSFKYYYLAFIIDELMKIKEKHISSENKKVDVLQIFSKHILKPTKDGSLDFLDSLLRECIKKFPFHDCTLFRQMVSSLTGQSAPSALSVVSAAVNGQRGFIDNVVVCQTCGEEKPNKKCSQCKTAQYCDKNCQKLHWYWHKKQCAKLAQSVQIEEQQDEEKIDANEVSAHIQNLLVSE